MSDPTILWNVVCQGPLPVVGFSRQKFWSGLPFPLPEGIFRPRIKLTSRVLHWQARSLPQHAGRPTACQVVLIAHLMLAATLRDGAFVLSF